MEKTVYMMIFCLVVSVVSEDLQDFPLWGSSWVVCDGEHKGIYRSSLPFSPEEALLVNFMRNKRRIEIQWANLKGRQWNSTASVLDEISRQWNVNSTIVQIKKKKNGGAEFWTKDLKNRVAMISQEPYNDTLWTAHFQAEELLTKYGYLSVTINVEDKETEYVGNQGVNLLREEIENGQAYTQEQPRATAVRWARSQDSKVFTDAVAMGDDFAYMEKVIINNEDLVDGIPHRQTTPFLQTTNTAVIDIESSAWMLNGKVYEDLTHMNFNTDKLAYWQVHLWPEVWYYPRSKMGSILRKLPRMTHAQAMNKKKQSLSDEGMEDVSMEIYRNPWRDDTASCMLSFQFVAGPHDLTHTRAIWLDGVAAGTSMDFTHVPKVMYNASNAYGGPQAALLLQYAETEKEMDLAATINERCAGWKVIDKLVGDAVFPEYDKETKRYSRNVDVDQTWFTFGNCPCYYEDKLGGLTKAQMRNFAYMPLPTCKRYAMRNALAFYQRILPEMMLEKSVAAVIWEKIKKLEYILDKKETSIANTFKQRYRSVNGDVVSMLDAFMNQVDFAEEQTCVKSWAESEIVEEILRRNGLTQQERRYQGNDEETF